MSDLVKIFERDKNVTISLDQDFDWSAFTLVPGVFLYNGANGAYPALGGVDVGGDPVAAVTITATNAGLFYVANDYYVNTIKTTLYNANNNGDIQALNAPNAGKIAAVPLADYFEMHVLVDSELEANDLVTIDEGEIVEAAAETFAFGMVTEDNGYTDTPVITKITTFMHRHTLPAGE